MGGEVINITEAANKVAEDIFKWFKWEKIPLMDENFPCHKVDQHKKKSKKKEDMQDKTHTHPVDVVFKYFDPYLNKIILLNTDLKSYAKSSIKKASVRSAVESLAKTIDCARSSPAWQKKYVLDNNFYEVRGMLFIYNHDDGYDKDFMSLLGSINSDNLSIKQDQMVHVIEPQRIRYLASVVADMNRLQARKELPLEKYSFFYPDLYLHKSHGNPDKYPATVEMLCAPFMILKHDEFKVLNESTEEIMTTGANGGYIIYYNQDGSTEYEFIYLLDALSRFQILSGKSTIKIRVAHHSPNTEIKSNYQKAVNLYDSLWGPDKHKRMDLDRIEFEVIQITVPQYIPGVLAWRHQNG